MDAVAAAVGPFRRTAALRCAAPLLSGLLLALAFPPLGWWPLAWIALIPWYVVLTPLPPSLRGKGEPVPFSTSASHEGGEEGEPSARRKALDARAHSSPFPRREGGRGVRQGSGWRGGFLFGATLFLVGLFWMNEIGAAPWIVLSLLQAVPFAFLGALCVALLPRLPTWARPLAFAALWVLFEGLRSWGRYAFPWFFLASTQVRAPALLQIVSVTGQWGLSFAVAAVNALLAEAFLRRETPRAALRLVLGAAALVTLLGAGGAVALRGAAGEGDPARTVAMAQGSVRKPVGSYTDMERDEILRTYSDLTRQAAETPSLALVAWPETVVPGALLRDPVLYERVTGLARALQTPILAGSIDVDEQNRLWNTALLLDKNGALAGRYDKTQLVPLGEFFPLRALLGSLYARYSAPQRDFTPGSAEGVFPIGSLPDRATTVGVIICYESAFGRLAAARTRRGAEALFVLTSDQAFGTSAGPYQHADLSVLRAVETRRWVVRAAATGISTLVDPWGRTHGSLGINQRGVLVGDIQLRSDVTLYALWGDWFLGVCALLVAAAFLIPLPPSLTSR